MRQPLVARPSNTHLRCAILGGDICNRMQVTHRQRRAEEALRDRRLRGIINALLYPNLIDKLILPVREEAYAIGTAEDCSEGIFQPGYGQVLIDMLPNRKLRFYSERERRDDPERAQMNDNSVERVAMILARDCDDVAIGIDDFHRHYGRGEVPIAIA